MDQPLLKNKATIGQWAITGEKPLGIGGQAEVWKARHRSEPHAPPVAIKLCRDENAKAHARFKREIELLQQYVHSSIVALRDHGFHNGQPFFAMEHANTTFDRLATDETPGVMVLQESPGLLLEFFRQACAGVAHLHSNGVLHRDLKPSNILVILDPKEGMRTVVADLGVSCLADSQGDLTHAQEVVGTPGYRAPECSGGEHFRSSDVYSLGKTLEFLFTRKKPVRRGPGKCSRDSRMSDALWDVLDALLERACDQAHEQRYQNAGELLAALPKVVLSPVEPAVVHRAADWRGFRWPSAVQPEMTLAAHEAEVLAAVIRECPLPGQAVSEVTLQRRMAMHGYRFSIAMRRLIRIGFVELVDVLDEEGNHYDKVAPTSAGEAWALDHPDQMIPPEPASSDNDIPF